MLKVPTKILLLEAALVWLLAGSSVAAVGVLACEAAWTLPLALAAILVYVLFLVLFLRISLRQIRRINAYTAKLTFMFNFFDAQSYVILAIMVFLGAAIRMLGVVPGTIIGFFYTGLGTALITAAVFYIVNYIAVCDELGFPSDNEAKPANDHVTPGEQESVSLQG